MNTSASIEDIATAFSKHEFGKAYPRLRNDVVWLLAGGGEMHGADEVREACEGTLRDLTDVDTAFERFRAFVGDSWVVIDSLARYTNADGEVSTVASCDIFDFNDGEVSAITSYNIEN